MTKFTILSRLFILGFLGYLSPMMIQEGIIQVEGIVLQKPYSSTDENDLLAQNDLLEGDYLVAEEKSLENSFLQVKDCDSNKEYEKTERKLKSQISGETLHNYGEALHNEKTQLLAADFNTATTRAGGQQLNLAHGQTLANGQTPAGEEKAAKVLNNVGNFLNQGKARNALLDQNQQPDQKTPINFAGSVEKTQPAPDGKGTQPAQDGSPPAANGSGTPPAPNGNGIQPAQDGTQPAANGSGAPPAANGNGNQPAQDGTQPAPTGGGTQPAPNGNGNQPAQDGNGNQPPEGTPRYVRKKRSGCEGCWTSLASPEDEEPLTTKPKEFQKQASDKKNQASDNNNQASDKKNEASDKKNQASDNNNQALDSNNQASDNKNQEDKIPEPKPSLTQHSTTMMMGRIPEENNFESDEDAKKSYDASTSEKKNESSDTKAEKNNSADTRKDRGKNREIDKKDKKDDSKETKKEEKKENRLKNENESDLLTETIEGLEFPVIEYDRCNCENFESNIPDQEDIHHTPDQEDIHHTPDQEDIHHTPDNKEGVHDNEDLEDPCTRKEKETLRFKCRNLNDQIENFSERNRILRGSIDKPDWKDFFYTWGEWIWTLGKANYKVCFTKRSYSQELLASLLLSIKDAKRLHFDEYYYQNRIRKNNNHTSKNDIIKGSDTKNDSTDPKDPNSTITKNVIEETVSWAFWNYLDASFNPNSIEKIKSISSNLSPTMFQNELDRKINVFLQSGNHSTNNTGNNSTNNTGDKDTKSLKSAIRDPSITIDVTPVEMAKQYVYPCLEMAEELRTWASQGYQLSPYYYQDENKKEEAIDENKKKQPGLLVGASFLQKSFLEESSLQKSFLQIIKRQSIKKSIFKDVPVNNKEPKDKSDTTSTLTTLTDLNNALQQHGSTSSTGGDLSGELLDVMTRIEKEFDSGEPSMCPLVGYMSMAINIRGKYPQNEVIANVFLDYHEMAKSIIKSKGVTATLSKIEKQRQLLQNAFQKIFLVEEKNDSKNDSDKKIVILKEVADRGALVLVRSANVNRMDFKKKLVGKIERKITALEDKDSSRDSSRTSTIIRDFLKSKDLIQKITVAHQEIEITLESYKQLQIYRSEKSFKKIKPNNSLLKDNVKSAISATSTALQNSVEAVVGKNHNDNDSSNNSSGGASFINKQQIISSKEQKFLRGSLRQYYGDEFKRRKFSFSSFLTNKSKDMMTKSKDNSTEDHHEGSFEGGLNLLSYELAKKLIEALSKAIGMDHCPIIDHDFMEKEHLSPENAAQIMQSYMWQLDYVLANPIIIEERKKQQKIEDDNSSTESDDLEKSDYGESDDDHKDSEDNSSTTRGDTLKNYRIYLENEIEKGTTSNIRLQTTINFFNTDHYNQAYECYYALYNNSNSLKNNKTLFATPTFNQDREELIKKWSNPEVEKLIFGKNGRINRSQKKNTNKKNTNKKSNTVILDVKPLPNNNKNGCTDGECSIQENEVVDQNLTRTSVDQNTITTTRSITFVQKFWKSETVENTSDQNSPSENDEEILHDDIESIETKLEQWKKIKHEIQRACKRAYIPRDAKLRTLMKELGEEMGFTR